MVMYGLLTYFAWTTAGGYQGIVSSFQAWGSPYNLRILGFTEDWPLGLWLAGWAFALLGWGPQQGWGVLGAKSEDDAIVGNTFGTRMLSWPGSLIFIPMALATMVHFPEIAFEELAFGKLVRILLPSGLMGLFVGVWLTPVLITAQVGRIWTGGTFANDFYRRLVAPGKSDRHYIWITRISLLSSSALAMMYAYYTYQVVPVMFWWATLNAGHAVGGLATYYWWRWGGWIALLTSLIHYPINIVIMNVFEGAYPVYTLQWIIMVLAWFPAMLLVWVLPPSSPDVLMDYYRRTRPPGFWGHIKLQVEELERAATSGL
jgi:Na+/proline symporter